MDIIQKVKKLFSGGDWYVLYRKKGSKEFTRYIGSKNFWYADPFLFQFNDKLYLFTESFDKKKQIGTISYSVFENDAFSKPIEIIRNNYHMSYPNVFSVNDRVFMMPETGESNQFCIYEASDFPHAWNKILVLKNVRWADSTYHYFDGKHFIIAFDERKNETYLYQLDLEKMLMKKLYSRVHDTKEYRPAGSFFIKNGSMFRPTQDCKNEYGGKLIINEVENFYDLSQKKVRVISPNDISPKYSKLHTYNEAGEYEVIDVFEKRKGFRCFIDNIRRKIHRRKIGKMKW